MTPVTPSGNLLPELAPGKPARTGGAGWHRRVFSGSDAELALEAEGRAGGWCLAIASGSGADASWTTTVQVERGCWYRLSGWVKTRDVSGATGALFNIQNMQQVRTAAMSGTGDWRRVSTVFRAEAEALEINALFGGWGESAGKAWYEGITLEAVEHGLATEADVKIDPTMAGPVISPQLFGHNLEHTRRTLWRGLSAEMVANRKFAAVNSGLAMHWWSLSTGGVSVDDETVYAGRHSLRLENPNGEDRGAWQQHDWLAFREGDRYVFRVWARAETEQSLWMRVVTRSGFTNVCGEETVVKPGAWRLWTGEFTAPCNARGARLELRLPTAGPLWVGAVSMMPADHFHGMRRDVVDLLKQVRPGNLRWPGGCFAEYYDWREGLLPVDQRPPIGPHRWVGLLPDSDGYDNHDIGIDEYIALCRELGAAPAITTRFSQGSPEEAAAWVEYCNGEATTRWGKVRAERGHPEPYGVAYWYVGNELTGMSLLEGEARTNPALLARLCREHIEAMRQVDPTLLLNVGIPSSPEWIAPLFEVAGAAVDEVQTGFYFQPDQPVTLADVAYTPVHDILPKLRAMRTMVDGVAGPGRRPGISYYEWNVMWDRSGDPRGGLFAAGMLNLFCREAEALGLVRASYFQPVTEGCIHVAPRSCRLEPDGQVFALYAAHQGNRRIPVPIAADHAVDLCASLDPDDGSVFVTLLNRSFARPGTVRLIMAGVEPRGGAIAQMLCPQGTGQVDGFIHRTEELALLNGTTATLELPPCSIAGVRFKTGGAMK